MPKLTRKKSLSQRSRYRSISGRRESSQISRPSQLRLRIPVVRLERLPDELLRGVLPAEIVDSQRRSRVPTVVSETSITHLIPVVMLERIDGRIHATGTADVPSEEGERNDSSEDMSGTLTPSPPRPRRRHAVVPHRVTYKAAYLANTNIENVPVHTLGNMRNVCRWCDALYFDCERSNRSNQRRNCCSLGEVVLPQLHNSPDVLRNYLTESDTSSVHFRRNIRAINSLFAMASFKTSLPQDRNVGQGHWCFHVCGQIYHYTESIPQTQEIQRPVLNQYYFVDAGEAIERRSEFLGDRVDRQLIENVEHMLRECNPWVSAYQTMREVIEERRREGIEVDNMVLAFRENMQTHLRNFSLPQSRSDVAALFCGEEPPFDVDLTIYPRQRQNVSRELKNLNRLPDPMVYPLLFPYGEYGYDLHIKYRSRPAKTVSIREFYRYRIQVRPGFSILHHSDKLFQQYVVDAWCKAEASDLWWLRRNQEKLRVAGRQAIQRMLQARAQEQNLRVGNVIVLPTAFFGGQRAQKRKYLDAMTVVSRLGKPDLFITMTCNPRWPEIANNLDGAQQWQHRPDLIVRVFREKLLEFMDDINNKQVYGVVLYSMYVIEFQKRGLPHAHILVALRPEDKPDTEEAIDGIICAYIPDVDTEPRLHNIVKETYVHRPCGTENPGATCMKEGRCTKGYPKQFVERTIFSNENLGQPIYKRPNDGRTLMVDGCVVDNRRIVPYNRYAAAKYQCHINFEICGSLESIKYLHKYVHKGSDYVTVQMRARDGALNWDEIQAYLDCRYVSAMEAAWRLFEYKMSDRTHSVLVLPVHLPNEQYVYFEEDQDVEEIAQAVDKPTKLMAYFTLNSREADARRLKYVEVPEHYTWADREAAWKKRQQVSKMFGCMVEVSPQEHEKFYLRLLLSNVRGATSFEDLRTVRGVTYETFREACVAIGLLDSSDEYDKCLTEARLYRTPFGLRKLFALLITVVTTDIAHQISMLWEGHRSELIRDFLERGMTDEVAEAKALQHISHVLARNGEHTLEEYGLPRLNTDLLLNLPPEENEGAHIYQMFQGSMEHLNEDQKVIYDAVMAAVTETDQNRVSKMFNVDAPGGTGKTYLFNTLIKEVRRQYDRHTIAVAWTGIAASLLIGGKTSHRAFKLPLNVNAQSTAGFPIESMISDSIRHSALLIWDEASMANKYAVEAVDRYLRDLMGVDVPMGGKVTVFGGDFRQVLPVVPRAHRTQVIEVTLKRSYLWPLMRHFKLLRNMRAGDEHRIFANWLLSMGDGRLPHVVVNSNDPSVPRDLIEIPPANLVSSKERLLKKVFGRTFTRRAAERAVLCPTNASVDDMNKHVLDALPGVMITYYSVDEYDNEDGDELYVPIDFINTVTVASLPPHELQLKVGATVMLLRNIDIDMGQCNGTRLTVISLGECIIELEMLTGTHKGDRILLPKIKMQATDPSLPKPIKRLQFPIKLAFAMTINKSQGQTFKKVGLCLEKPCFSHGQLYVAFSRVGAQENISVYVENTTRQGSFRFRNRKFTRNVVYESIIDSTERVSVRRIENESDVDRIDSDSSLSSLDIEDILNDMRISSVPSLIEPMSPDVQGILMPPQYEAGAERIMIPQLSRQQLAERVATGQRAGTSGAYLRRNIQRPERTYSSSSSE